MYGWMYVCMDVWMYFTCRTSLASLPIVHINAARNGLQHLQHWKLQGQKKNNFNLSASEKNPCLGWLFMSTLRTSLEELEAFVFFFTCETEHRGFAFRRGKQFSNSPVSRFCFSHALRVRMGMVATFLRSCSIPGQPGSISKLFFPEVFSRALITPQKLQ